MITATYQYRIRPVGDSQTLVYLVKGPPFAYFGRFVHINVNSHWLATEASLNDLKSMAVAQATAEAST